MALSSIIIIGVVVIVALVFGLIFYKTKSKRPTVPIDQKDIKMRWSRINKMLGSYKEMNCKIAIIEADKLLDSVLTEMKIDGQTPTERLQNAAYQYPKLKQVLWAHKMRNQIVSKKHTHVRYTVAQKVISVFKNALKDLGAM
jgi:ssDNA-binding Zn-finger/Zn-ribbon topoisomerase 1